MKFKGYTLNPFQVKAAQALESDKNVLVSAPTGAGKTLVAEYAIAQAIAAGRRVIYTSPIKALSNQKYRDFKAEGMEVGLQTGDLTLDAHMPLVIMTTEIFRNAVFEDPLRFADLDFIIFDEIHFLDDRDRGTVWEESLIFAPAHVRFVGLSATIANLQQFGNWLASIREHELELIHHGRRPVPLKHTLCHLDTGFFNLPQRKRAIDRLKRAQKKGGADRFERPGRGRGRPQRGGRRGFQRDRDRKRRSPRYAQLSTGMVLDHLQEEKLLPVLFFCFSRKECEIKAEMQKHRNLLDRRQRHLIADLFDELCDKFELDYDNDAELRAIEQRTLRGVGYHHAGMLPIHKEVVERLFTSGLLRLLFTTETFALGINMPARTVVFDSLRKFDGISFDYMKVRDYMQMAGRAGRQGIDDEGLVISVLDDDDVEGAPLPALFGNKVEPVVSRFNLSYSTILNLFEHLGGKLMIAYDKSFAAFQAASGSKKQREKVRNAERAALRARVRLLEEAGYMNKEGLLPRGRMAKAINGYEIQVTELFYAGVLDRMNMHQLAATFTSLVHEDRRRDQQNPMGRKVLGPLAHEVEQAVRRFISLEARAGFEHTIKEPCFSVCPAVDAWSRGSDIEKVEDLAGQDGGDIVRTMRMAVQMMRQLRTTLGKGYPLFDRLSEAEVSINRDVVDAKRQFELG